MVSVAALAGAPATQAQDIPMIGQMTLVSFNFCPRGFLDANGQQISIATYDALFSLIGTTYGGDGITTFRVPDLRGRVPVGVGQGPGLSPVTLGQALGNEAVTLTTAQLPQHTHALQASSAAATHAAPASGRVLGATQNAGSYVAGSADTVLGNSSVGTAGSGQPHSVRDPSLGMRWCIAVEGVYPPRP